MPQPQFGPLGVLHPEDIAIDEVSAGRGDLIPVNPDMAFPDAIILAWTEAYPTGETKCDQVFSGGLMPSFCIFL